MGVLIWNTAVALFGTAKLILREIPQNALIWCGGIFGPPDLAGIARPPNCSASCGTWDGLSR
jgi:hypothetical protein